MTKTLLLIIFLTISQILYAQNKNNIVISYGLAANVLIRTASLDGDASYDGKGANIFEIHYLRKVTEKFSLRAGFAYSINKFNITWNLGPTVDVMPYQEEIQMLSIPVFANFNFGKHFFIDAGLITDIEMNRKENKVTDSQSGIGFGTGIGLKYTYNKAGIFINPFLNVHVLIPFHKEKYQQHLVEGGIKFGVFYNF